MWLIPRRCRIAPYRLEEKLLKLHQKFLGPRWPNWQCEPNSHQYTYIFIWWQINLQIQSSMQIHHRLQSSLWLAVVFGLATVEPVVVVVAAAAPAAGNGMSTAPGIVVALTTRKHRCGNTTWAILRCRSAFVVLKYDMVHFSANWKPFLCKNVLANL